ncbi:MAG: hypothetical protein JW900_02335 [Anaerolineae bacterium]|nr:hypothetical protein [Anaerolineae bacterium]
MKGISVQSLLLVVILASSCTAGAVVSPTAVSPATLSPSPTPFLEEAVTARAAQILQALESRDMAALSSYVHPIEGVRFSPYGFVREADLVFTAGQVAGLLADPTRHVWGAYDGSGLPIELTFAEYYEQFVYDQDFVDAEQVGYNEVIGVGNTLDNWREFYPGANMVEYHFPGFDPAFAGMDWVSLRLVLQEYEGGWYLVGIIHDEWTI